MSSNPIKTARKTAGRSFQRGIDPRRGCGKKGRSGRKSDEFKAMCQALASSRAIELTIRNILQDAKHPAFLGALKWASAYGYGRPQETIDHTIMTTEERERRLVTLLEQGTRRLTKSIGQPLI